MLSVSSRREQFSKRCIIIYMYVQDGTAMRLHDRELLDKIKTSIIALDNER